MPEPRSKAIILKINGQTGDKDSIPVKVARRSHGIAMIRKLSQKQIRANPKSSKVVNE
jgi:hypothetical protein